MSGTRSPSPKAPATEALIVAHGQPSAPAPAEAALRTLASAVAGLLPQWRVRSATMAAPGRLEGELAGAREPLVFPLFMSDGWFTQTALRARLKGGPGRVLAPLGLDPSLPAFAARQLDAFARSRGWAQAETEVLIAAHGSGSGRSNPSRCAYRFADALSLLAPWSRVRVGFLEEEPGLPAVAAECATKTICLPFFAADGFHVSRDVPAALRRGGFRGGLCASVGNADYIPALIAGALKAAALEKAA